MLTRFIFSGTSSVIVATPDAARRDVEAVVGHGRLSGSVALVVPQDAAQDLAGRALRQLVEEAVLARPLEGRERRRGQAVAVELGGVGRVRRGQDDAGDDALAEALVRCGHDRAPRAPPVAHQPLLDLDGVHVSPPEMIMSSVRRPGTGRRRRRGGRGSPG
jgi:hypothetical protein